MKNVIIEKLSSISSVEEKYNTLREFLQSLVLKEIETQGHVKNIAFVGGTALRFLYGLKRFSEDLDFSLVQKENFSFEKLLSDITRSFDSWGIKVETKPKTVRTVISSFLKFSDLMYEHGLSHRKDHKFLIKFEIDCNPPSGFVTELSFNQRYLPMNLFHYNEPSLFAGKLHAVLFRQYTKGRDFYDLMWFLGRGTSPNLPLLENAIFQTTGNKIKLTVPELKKMLLKRINEADFVKIQEELKIFLVDKSEVSYVTAQNLAQLVEKAKNPS